jgi:hypothetical protein
MINKSYKLVEMKIIIERSNDNEHWVVMLQDMLGKRPYVSTKFDNPDMALNYITDEFKNCSDFECEINKKINDDRDKGN